VEKSVASSKKNQPNQRSCIACRRRTERTGLLRLVLINKELQIDLTGGLGGRGAYICNNIECWQKAEKKNAFAYRLKTKIPPNIIEKLHTAWFKKKS
jgi:uncharacterized protein